MRVVKKIFKVMIAGVLSIVILSAMLCVYSVTPVHITNMIGNTDYVWQPNAIWMKMTEGISWGQFDTNGYNNKEVVDNPEIIVLGSSHMEGTNVLQEQMVSSILGERLESRYSVYNMAISGHHFLKVCQYLQENIDLYEDSLKVVLIETSSYRVKRENVEQVIEKKVDYSPSHSTGLMGILQRVPFIRCVYQQAVGGLIERFVPELKSEKNEEPWIIDEDAYDTLFTYLSEIETENKVQLVIFNHPVGELKKDGTIEFEKSEEMSVFKEYSEQYGIDFVDTTERLESMYYDEHRVAHGFVTGELATGHLNAYGHSAVADCLYNEINRLEEAGEICR